LAFSHTRHQQAELMWWKAVNAAPIMQQAGWLGLIHSCRMRAGQAQG
jgi:hypothetical protein